MHRTSVVAAVLAALITSPAAADWAGCPSGDLGACRPVFLNVITRQGDARLSVDNHCRGGGRHVWGRNDARLSVQQWLDDDAARGAGRLCVQLDPRVDEVRIISSGGDCGVPPDTATASHPGPDMILRRSYGGARVATLRGCHATVGTGDAEIAFGGIALDFADGYGFGDAYARDQFYSVFDGFGRGRVRPLGATVRAISGSNTFHYRIEVWANGRPATSATLGD